jgi:hypothetical protein
VGSERANLEVAGQFMRDSTNASFLGSKRRLTVVSPRPVMTGGRGIRVVGIALSHSASQFLRHLPAALEFHHASAAPGQTKLRIEEIRLELGFSGIVSIIFTVALL